MTAPATTTEFVPGPSLAIDIPILTDSHWIDALFMATLGRHSNLAGSAVILQAAIDNMALDMPRGLVQKVRMATSEGSVDVSLRDSDRFKLSLRFAAMQRRLTVDMAYAKHSLRIAIEPRKRVPTAFLLSVNAPVRMATHMVDLLASKWNFIDAQVSAKVDASLPIHQADGSEFDLSAPL